MKQVDRKVGMMGEKSLTRDKRGEGRQVAAKSWCRAHWPLGLNFPKLGKLQRVLELQWGWREGEDALGMSSLPCMTHLGQKGQGRHI